MIDLPLLWSWVLRPVPGFKESKAANPSLSLAVQRMLLLRVPVAMLDAILMYWNARTFWGSLKNLDGSFGKLLHQHLPPEMPFEDLRVFFKGIPDLPSFTTVLPWLLIVAVLGIVGAWLHHAVWDHTCLWMLGGLKERKGFRVSLIAEAEALSVGVFGSLLGLLASIPVVGCLFGALSSLAGIWFWGLRGVALATYHGCPVWKGVVATVLHALLMGLFAVLYGVLVDHHGHGRTGGRMKGARVPWFAVVWIGLAGLALGGLFLAQEGRLPMLPCPFKAITGIPCASCGFTRCGLALARLDLAQAFHWHPVATLGAFLSPFVVVWDARRAWRGDSYPGLPDSLMLRLSVAFFFVFTWVLQVARGV